MALDAGKGAVYRDETCLRALEDFLEQAARDQAARAA